jgi:putative SOS response-associated peptidase YedK
MCGRFQRHSTEAMLADWFEVEQNEKPFFAPSYNIAPQSVQPVVRLNAESGRREFALARWGLIPSWAKEAKFGYSTINARAEEAATKPAFREALKKRRCLVPADGFYEWKRLEGGRGIQAKQAYAIALRSGEPCAFAGLWERWQSREGEGLESFTILTTKPNALMESIHNRMPVILEPRDYARWLAPGEPASELLRPYPAEKMHAWPVCERVGNVRNNDAGLLERL